MEPRWPTADVRTVASSRLGHSGAAYFVAGRDEKVTSAGRKVSKVGAGSPQKERPIPSRSWLRPACCCCCCSLATPTVRFFERTCVHRRECLMSPVLSSPAMVTVSLGWSQQAGLGCQKCSSGRWQRKNPQTHNKFDDVHATRRAAS